jgi:hypothetical protein
MKTLIFQTSPPHTGSTVLVNALYGLIPELTSKKIIGTWSENFEQCFSNILLIKTHELNIDDLILKYGEKYKLYFICSERKEYNYLIENKYKTYDNVIIFDYGELNETESNSVKNIIENIYKKIQPILNIPLNIESGVKRIIQMNRRYNEIKNFPFKYVDKFFEIHGSHRNRSKNIT